MRPTRGNRRNSENGGAQGGKAREKAANPPPRPTAQAVARRKGDQGMPKRRGTGFSGPSFSCENNARFAHGATFVSRSRGSGQPQGARASRDLPDRDFYRPRSAVSPVPAAFSAIRAPPLAAGVAMSDYSSKSTKSRTVLF